MSGSQRPAPARGLVRAVAGGTALAGALLVLAAPTPPAAVVHVRDAGAAADETVPLVALLSLAAWALTAWLTVAVVLTAAAHLPGLLGAVAGAVARRVAPSAVRRGIEVVLGVTVAFAAVGAAPATAAPGPPRGPVGAPAADALNSPVAPTLDWPTTSGATPGAPAPAPALDWPAAADGHTGAPATPAPDPVVVQRGDCLWAIAEQDLAARGEAPSDARIAQAWPSWWAANRDAIGDDPDHLLPGTPLNPPPADGPASS